MKLAYLFKAKMESKGELAKAIIQVMKAVKKIDKNMTVGTGNSAYKGVADEDVKEAIGEAMEEAGLCLLPIDVEAKTSVDRWEETNQYGTKMKQSVFTEANTKYLLLHISGESQIVSGYGQGVDSQDKGAGKATTYALKNTLLYMFLVPTKKIDDTDKTHSENHSVPGKTQNNTPTKNKTKLLPNTPVWDGAVKYLIGHGTIDELKNHHIISPEHEELLKQQVL